MKSRLNTYQVAPDTIKALSALEAKVQGSGLEKSLIELVKTRASQINGCAFCINMHTEDARKHGETEQRLYLLNAWREAPFYTDRERAALAWTEAVTLISETHAPDDVYEEIRKHFSEEETVNLTMLVATINAWNRIAISFRSVPPAKAKAAAAYLPPRRGVSHRLREITPRRRHGVPVESAKTSIKTSKIISWNDHSTGRTLSVNTIIPDRRETEREFCHDAPQSDGQIACGFGRHIDRFTCARDANCAARCSLSFLRAKSGRTALDRREYEAG